MVEVTKQTQDAKDKIQQEKDKYFNRFGTY